MYGSMARPCLSCVPSAVLQMSQDTDVTHTGRILISRERLVSQRANKNASNVYNSVSGWEQNQCQAAVHI